MIREIKNNNLEIRQEEVQEFTENEIKTACGQLLKIMSDASNYEITYDKAHDAPSLKNSYIGDFTETNKFGEEITGRGLFFPNTKFIFKNDDNREVTSLYLVKTNYHIMMMIDRLAIYDLKENKLFNYTLSSPLLSDELFYTYEENKVIRLYLSKITSLNEDLQRLNNIEFFYKKTGECFKDLHKCIKYKTFIFKNYYSLEFNYNQNELVNYDYLTNYNLVVKIEGDYNTEEGYNAAVIAELKKVIKQLSISIKEDIKHYQFIIDNAKTLTNEYLEINKKIDALKSSMNNDIRRALQD